MEAPLPDPTRDSFFAIEFVYDPVQGRVCFGSLAAACSFLAQDLDCFILVVLPALSHTRQFPAYLVSHSTSDDTWRGSMEEFRMGVTSIFIIKWDVFSSLVSGTFISSLRTPLAQPKYDDDVVLSSVAREHFTPQENIFQTAFFAPHYWILYLLPSSYEKTIPTGLKQPDNSSVGHCTQCLRVTPFAEPTSCAMKPVSYVSVPPFRGDPVRSRLTMIRLVVSSPNSHSCFQSSSNSCKGIRCIPPISIGILFALL